MPMPLSLPVRLSRADFVTAPCNAAALAMLEGDDWPQGKLVLTGPQGAGKTHLLHIWAARRDALLLDGTTLGAADPAHLAARGAVAIDGAAQVAGDPRAERALFHLHNMLAAGGGHLLLAARAPVRDWGIALPDLASRLLAAAHVTLGAPDDALLAAVLDKLFADRQLTIPDTLIPYLLARMTRSLAAAQMLVARLDAESIARKKPVSLRLAGEVLQIMQD
ncbi:MAG: chromosomal replication initiator DnaA [Rhodobacteraceae bacterium]|nr:chromosomal replication initiator DnaA [Paracoccaceae bacterium]TVR46141.1 MAG: chromosomal replication initiator DnaA [Paracoccaceae bacterium]